MTENIEVRADFNYLYRNDHKFFPVIQEQSLESEMLDAANAVLITLSASADADLIWEKERAYAEKVAEEGKLILWELDFGLSLKKIDAADSSLFYSYGIAVDEFVNTLWRELKDSSIGVIIYRGDAHFSHKFAWNEEHKEYFLEKLNSHDSKEEIQAIIESNGDRWSESLEGNKAFELFAADVFAEYYQRLVSYLPDTVMAFALLDVSEQPSLAFLSQLLSKERFQHILLGLKRSAIPAGHLNWEEGSCLGGWIGQNSPYFSTVSEVSLGLCLPPDEAFSDEVYGALNELLHELKEARIPYRIIPESLLTEAWDGIDDIIVFTSTVTVQRKRRLQGFCAAGGRVVCIGESLNLASEIVYEEFRVQLSTAEALI